MKAIKLKPRNTGPRNQTAIDVDAELAKWLPPESEDEEDGEDLGDMSVHERRIHVQKKVLYKNPTKYVIKSSQNSHVVQVSMVRPFVKKNIFRRSLR